MNFIWHAYPQGGSELLLMLALADHADDTGDRIYPSVQTMARKTRMSERTVQYLLRRMQERGWLLLVEPGGGRNRTARYRIVIEAIGNSADFAPNRKGCKQEQERVQKSTGNGATAVAPEPPVEPSRTTTTTTPVVVVDGLEWPALPSEHRKLAGEILAQCPVEFRQPVLDEWATAIKDGKIQRSSPVPYLRSLVVRAVKGTFTPDAGVALSARRRQGSGGDAHKQRLAASKQTFERLMASRRTDKDAS